MHSAFENTFEQMFCPSVTLLKSFFSSCSSEAGKKEEASYPL